jgi:hypothetical protein
MTDPQTGLTLFNAIATAGKTLYEIAQGTSKLETKQQLMDVYNSLMNLKREAADLEDENRNLTERLRFKSDDFEFKNPFWYEKTHADRPLCAKCFATQTIAPMGEPYRATGMWRSCLVCGNAVQVERDTNTTRGNQWY